MHEFDLDLSAALLGPTGDPLASGHTLASLRVVSQPVERRITINLGKIPDNPAPTALAIAITPGHVTSAPMGSFWGSFASIESHFPIPNLLASTDTTTQRTGLNALVHPGANRAIQSELFADVYNPRYARNGTQSRQAQLAPLADPLAKLAREPGPADIRADAARFLAYSESKTAANTLRPLASEPNKEVSEAAMIGLTFLGETQYLEQLKAIINRPPTPPQPRAQWPLIRLDEDPLIALAHQHSDAAIGILGAALTANLQAIQQAKVPQPQLTALAWRATSICKLLGRAGNPRAYHWLTLADNLIAANPEIAKHVSRDNLTQAMLQFPHRQGKN